MTYSRYNYFLQDTKNSMLLFNSLHGEFIRLIDDKGRIAEYVSRIKKREVTDGLFTDILTKHKMIVPYEDDEARDLIRLKECVIDEKDTLNLIILPTEKCNFRCIYCYENHQNKTMTRETVEQIYEFVKPRLPQLRGIALNWFGGEPLLSVDLIETITLQIKEYARPYGVRVVGSMTTNGYILSPAMVNRLKKCNVFDYQITVDGPSHVHDRQRFLSNGKGTWKEIVSNLLDIRDTCKSGMLNFKIRVNLSKAIYREYKRFFAELSEWFGDDRRFEFLLRLVSDYGNMTEETRNSLFCTEEEYIEVLTYMLKLDMKCVSMKAMLDPGGLLCYAFKKNSFVIMPDGTIRKCTLNLENDINYVGHLSKPDIDYDAFFFQEQEGMDRCKYCEKYPICLKVNCNMSTNEEAQCDIDIRSWDVLLPLLANEKYKCIEYHL